MYASGEGVPQDFAEAFKWYRLAAMQGDAFAQAKLGYMYFTGQGVPQDYVTAHMWYNLAAADGQNSELQESSAKGRSSVAAKMTPADISGAQRRARICLESDYQECN